MSPDDVDGIALAVFDLVVDMGYALDENDEWDKIKNLLHEKLEPYITKDRNYN